MPMLAQTQHPVEGNSREVSRSFIDRNTVDDVAVVRDQQVGVEITPQRLAQVPGAPSVAGWAAPTNKGRFDMEIRVLIAIYIGCRLPAVNYGMPFILR